MLRLACIGGLVVIGTGAAIVLIVSEWAIEKLGAVDELGEELENERAQRDGVVFSKFAGVA